MVEFTGERVIPGQVDVDLWNEHIARYAFASRLAAGRRVLDAGCGAGYGSAELARTASSVLALDASLDAVRYAREHYSAPNLHFLAASCEALPLPGASVGLVVAFEVVEHLAGWRQFLTGVRRVLAPAGQLVISTPNKDYYAESRRLTGPNPYHVHEFEFDEFSAHLRELFPHVTLFLQNHVAGIAFQPVAGDTNAAPQLATGNREAEPGGAHFFIAVCSLAPQAAASPFLYLPSSANVLRERELHIQRLDAELATKNGWIDDLRNEKQNLVEMFRAQTAELERSNSWAQDLGAQLHAAQDRILELQRELDRTIAGYQASIAAYEDRLAELDRENRAKTGWAEAIQRELDAKGKDLLHCMELLDTAEATVQERTQWAQRLDAEVKQLETQVSMVRASRWFKLGRTIRLGPVLPNG